MSAVFDVAVAALDTLPGDDPVLDGAPSCRYIDAGPPSWDSYPCLIVYPGGPALADTLPLSPVLAPAHRIVTMGEVDLVSITTTILRCAAIIDEEGNLPQASAHDVAAYQSSADLWAIWNAIKTSKRDGTLFPPNERELFLDPSVVLNQQGGACGWQITIRVQLDGYRPTLT
jgi:hypothetical protein